MPQFILSNANRRRWMLALALCFSLTATAQGLPRAKNPEEVGLSSERLKRLSETFKGEIGKGIMPGAVLLIARRGKVAHYEALGVRDPQTSDAMPVDAIFRLASMTKPMVSMAIMMLVEEGRMALTDPLSRYLPEFKNLQVGVEQKDASGETRLVLEPMRREMTIQDLLRHTAGLTYGGGLPGVGIQHPVDPVYRSLKVRSFGGSDSVATFMDKLGQTPLAYQPGERWMYSLATDACGALVEIISGMPFAQYLQQTIFDPLGMTDTSFQVSADKQPRLAANYQRGADKKLALIDDPATSAYLKAPGFCSGGGGLTGTTADYLRFCEMLRRAGELDGARIIGPRTLAMMHMNHLKSGQDLMSSAIGSFAETAYAGVGFGLGFASTMDQVAAGVLGGGDYYWGGAASTIFAIDPKEQLSMVFMTQLMPSSTFNFRGQLKNLLYGAIVD